ncbi:MAG TPA: glycosyltransferase family 4 protein [Verrucomicrobiae bacterium]|nr:glycosyltransferase family 4 protein [Verrucomicrobiae bacterium]
MNIVQLTPGAGGMYCGNCFHDNALVAALRSMGHDALMLPLYLPLNVEDEDQSAGQPIFFGGVNVYLEQKSALYRNAPNWLRRLLNSRRVLEWAAGRAVKTRADEAAELLISMLRGEAGNQNREITELINWLREHQKPDVICLSNALLIGMVRRLKAELGVPVVCLLQGEEPYLDSLPDAQREPAWRLLAERAVDVDAWIAPSRWNADCLIKRLNLPPDRVHVVHNGISLDGFEIRNPNPEIRNTKAPVLGYFARMCKDKGLDTLVEAFIHLKNRGTVPRLKLHIGGGCGPGDEPFVKSLRVRLAEAGFIGEVSFSPNLSRVEKLAFLQSLTVFSVPAMYGEAFGLYLIEAMAAGVPVVQPRHGGFPEIIAATGGGLLCEPNDAKSLADALGQLLTNPEQARAMGEAGRRAVSENFTAEAMAQRTLRVFETAISNRKS